MMKTFIKLALLTLCILMLPMKPRCLTSGHLAYNNPYYIRPTKPPDTRIKVQIDVRDDLTDGSLDSIQEVTFDSKALALQPKDFMGHRGTFNFKTTAGTHEIVWTLSTNTNYPNIQTYRRTIDIPSTAILFFAEIYRDEITVQVTQ